MVYEDLNGGKVVGNLFSTREKIAAALNVPMDGIVEHLLHAITNPEPCEIVDRPEFREVSAELDLMKLPIPKYFPEDGGRYITSGVIVTDYNGTKNVSFHRMMIMDRNHIAVRLVPRHLFTIYNTAKKNGEELRRSSGSPSASEQGRRSFWQPPHPWTSAPTSWRSPPPCSGRATAHR